MDHRTLDVPYFSQWETPEMTLPVLSEGATALHRDPLWRGSGAETIEEYARLAVNVCGMACLKMILAVRGEAYPILSLARTCTDYGGYVVNEADASIKGLIYAPFEGKGYALEAARAMRDWAFAGLKLPTLVSYVDQDNARSRALAEKLGARLDPDAPRQDKEDLVYRHVAG